MMKENEPVQERPWHERIDELVERADRIVKEYQSPFKNDAKGTLDCYLLEDRLIECKKILNRYKKKEE